MRVAVKSGICFQPNALVNNFAASCCVFMIVAQSAWAQSYPSKPIRFVVPQPPGGGADIVGRIVALKLQETLGRQVIVDNRSGAGGIVGTELVAHAPADGYTLLLGYTGVLTINPSLHQQLPYRPLQDFAPISVAAASPLILATAPALKVNTVAELIAAAKVRPAPITYGSPGNGSLHHLSMEWLRSASGMQLVHVPYKGFNSFNAVIAGEIGMAFVSVVGGLPHARAGRVKVIAITSKARSALLPDVPPLADTIPGFEAVNWFGVLAPRGTPDAVISILAQAIGKVMQADDVKQRFMKEGADSIGSTPAVFTELIRTEIKRWAEVIRTSGARVD
jgi:tripartite-type tricarboxylate transporter receptor subunit TctC